MMPLTTSPPYLFLLLLSVTKLSGAVVNPDLRATYRCNPQNNDHTVAHPIPMSCAVAIIQLPEPRNAADWHHGHNGEVVYDHPLTSTGNPHSLYHLPQESVVTGCRVKVELRPDVQSANVVWSDVKLYALTLVRRCVGHERIDAGSGGLGTGGICDLNAVRVTVESVGSSLSSGSSSSWSTLSDPSESWSSAGSNSEGMDTTA